MRFLFPSHFQQLLVGDPDTRWDIIPGVGLPRGSPLCVMGSNQILGRQTCLRSPVTKRLPDHSLKQPLEQHQMLPVSTKTCIRSL